MDRYKSLAAWQLGHRAVLLGLPLCDGARTHARGWLFDQIGRALVSVEANVVEGYALETRAQFRRHLIIARGSAAEAEILLHDAIELAWVPPDPATEVLAALDQALGAIHGLIRKLSG